MEQQQQKDLETYLLKSSISASAVYLIISIRASAAHQMSSRSYYAESQIKQLLNQLRVIFKNYFSKIY